MEIFEFLRTDLQARKHGRWVASTAGEVYVLQLPRNVPANARHRRQLQLEGNGRLQPQVPESDALLDEPTYVAQRNRETFEVSDVR